METPSAQPSFFRLQTSSVTDFLLSTPTIMLIALVSVIGAAPFMPLFDLDEGAFSEATREMLASGNWISTYLNGEPRHDKPILIYWFQAVSVSIFGVNPLAFRIPSMLAALAWMLVVYRFAREYYGDVTARISVWILATSSLATVIFKAAIADALLNWLLCLIFFDIYRYVEKPSNKKLLLLGIYMGLGFLTKGPIALVLPVFTSLVVFSYFGKFFTWLRAVSSPVSWVTLIAVIAPWHVAVYLDQGVEFFQGFYLGHNLGRFSDTMESHGGYPVYYLVLLPFLVAPFTRVFFADLLQVNQRRKELLWSYLIFWFVTTLTIFSFSKTQLPHYLLYGLSPVFILIARQIARYYEYMKLGSNEVNKSLIKWDVFIAVGFFCLLSAVPFLLPKIIESMRFSYDKLVLTHVDLYFQSSYLSFLTVIFTGVIAFFAIKRFNLLSQILINSLCIMLTFNFVLGVIVSAGQQQPVLNAANFVKQNYAAKTPVSIVSYRIAMPSFSVYLNQVVPEQVPKLGDLVYTRVDREESLRNIDPSVEIELLFNEGGIALYRYGVKNE